MKMEIKILIISLIFFVILYTVCNIVVDRYFLGSLVFGYLTTALNFMLMSRKIRIVFTSYASGYRVNGYFLRIVFMLIIYFLWFKYETVNVWGLLVGISIIPFTIPLIVIFDKRRRTNGAST